HFTNKFLGYDMREQIKDCFPSLLLSVVMAAVVVMADVWIEIGGVLELLLLINLGAAFYLACNMLFSIGAFKEAVGLIKGEARA
ncbi:MAG: hypothetical protein KJP19_09565, partial [Deltaproteobacteria bacterium]|nr:hypothetical protein [Deltaproteobacteria bacterium]